VVYRRIGVRVTAVSKAAVAAVNPDLRGGLYIDEVATGGAAAAAGLARGDVLIGFQLKEAWECLSPDHILHVLNHKDFTASQPLKVFFVRAGKLRETTVTPDN
jgi:S1-C subfamily serine protease